MRNPNLFKGRWWVAFYDDGDDIVAVTDGAADVARQMGKSMADSYSLLSRLFPGGAMPHKRRCVIRGRLCAAYFYDEETGECVCSLDDLRESKAGGRSKR